MSVDQTRIERLFKSQDRVRQLYHSGEIDMALTEFDSCIGAETRNIDPRIKRCARRIAQSILRMSNDDLAALGITSTDAGAVK